MSAKHLFLSLAVAVLAGAGGWFAARQAAGRPESAGAAEKIYSCSMHPQIRSPKPGKCTICGMDLAPLSQMGQGGNFEGRVMLSPSRINAINVQTVEVRRHPLRRTLRVAGTIEENDARHRFISAYVDGRIDRLFVNYTGAEVTAGELLAKVFSPPLLAAEKEYIALVRQRPAPQLPELQTERERLLAGARQRLLQFGLTEQQIAALPEKAEGDIHTDIIAPVSGTVVNRFVYEGQYVKEGDRLFEIADFSTMWFRFDAYERDLSWLQIGQPVDITTPAAPGKVYSAPIAFIDPNINDPTRSAKVRVELKNPLVGEAGRARRELYHRLYAEGAVKIEAPAVLAVPRGAVLAPGAQAIVYVDKGERTYEQRKVKLGRAGDELWEVLAGLKEGEQVVTTGNLLIDAQAQLDSGGMGSEAPAATLPEFTQEQGPAVEEFLARADAVSVALAADKLEDYNQQAGRLHAALAALDAACSNAPAWQPLVKKLLSTGHLPSAPDLTAARKAFHPFSAAVVEFAQAARQQAAFQSVKIYRCPMTTQSFPGAPKTASWVQLEPPLRNPYFGAEMLDCGTEVKP